eukprot:gnl/Chilomastix_cuspidata/5755.p1 GENE.gnl/Chilomastix_cuspidata/5755~~gnl/Chilomastix_cuspidata/5755.p1  ORF type:complete len:2838 (-),score=202.55 gnl/Chilomastix_cuspidata/5755:999-9512(-)
MFLTSMRTVPEDSYEDVILSNLNLIYSIVTGNPTILQQLETQIPPDMFANSVLGPFKTGCEITEKIIVAIFNMATDNPIVHERVSAKITSSYFLKVILIILGFKDIPLFLESKILDQLVHFAEAHFSNHMAMFSAHTFSTVLNYIPMFEEKRNQLIKVIEIWKETTAETSSESDISNADTLLENSIEFFSKKIERRSLLSCSLDSYPEYRRLLDIEKPFQQNNGSSTDHYTLLIRRSLFLLSVLGAHTLPDVKQLLKQLRVRSDGKTRLFLPLYIRSIERMIVKTDSPSSFFGLDGKNSCISLPPILKWPAIKGFTIACWLNIDSNQFLSANEGEKLKKRPRIFSFLSGTELGLECILNEAANNSAKIVLTFYEMSATREKKRIAGKYPFDLALLPLNKWFHFGLSITPSSSKTLKGISKLYINGELKESIRISLDPKICSTAPLSNCVFFSSSRSSTQIQLKKKGETPFSLQGQFSSLLFFTEVLSQNTLGEIFSMDPKVILMHIITSSSETKKFTTHKQEIPESFKSPVIKHTDLSELSLSLSTSSPLNVPLFGSSSQKPTNDLASNRPIFQNLLLAFFPENVIPSTCEIQNITPDVNWKTFNYNATYSQGVTFWSLYPTVELLESIGLMKSFLPLFQQLSLLPAPNSSEISEDEVTFDKTLPNVVLSLFSTIIKLKPLVAFENVTPTEFGAVIRNIPRKLINKEFVRQLIWIIAHLLKPEFDKIRTEYIRNILTASFLSVLSYECNISLIDEFQRFFEENAKGFLMGNTGALQDPIVNIAVPKESLFLRQIGVSHLLGELFDDLFVQSDFSKKKLYEIQNRWFRLFASSFLHHRDATISANGIEICQSCLTLLSPSELGPLIRLLVDDTASPIQLSQICFFFLYLFEENLVSSYGIIQALFSNLKLSMDAVDHKWLKQPQLSPKIESLVEDLRLFVDKALFLELSSHLNTPSVISSLPFLSALTHMKNAIQNSFLETKKSMLPKYHKFRTTICLIVLHLLSEDRYTHLKEATLVGENLPMKLRTKENDMNSIPQYLFTKGVPHLFYGNEDVRAETHPFTSVLPKHYDILYDLLSEPTLLFILNFLSSFLKETVDPSLVYSVMRCMTGFRNTNVTLHDEKGKCFLKMNKPVYDKNLLAIDPSALKPSTPPLEFFNNLCFVPFFTDSSYNTNLFITSPEAFTFFVKSLIPNMKGELLFKSLIDLQILLLKYSHNCDLLLSIPQWELTFIDLFKNISWRQKPSSSDTPFSSTPCVIDEILALYSDKELFSQIGFLTIEDFICGLPSTDNDLFLYSILIEIVGMLFARMLLQPCGGKKIYSVFQAIEQLVLKRSASDECDLYAINRFTINRMIYLSMVQKIHQSIGFLLPILQKDYILENFAIVFAYVDHLLLTSPIQYIFLGRAVYPLLENNDLFLLLKQYKNSTPRKIKLASGLVSFFQELILEKANKHILIMFQKFLGKGEFSFGVNMSIFNFGVFEDKLVYPLLSLMHKTHMHTITRIRSTSGKHIIKFLRAKNEFKIRLATLSVIHQMQFATTLLDEKIKSHRFEGLSKELEGKPENASPFFKSYMGLFLRIAVQSLNTNDLSCLITITEEIRHIFRMPLNTSDEISGLVLLLKRISKNNCELPPDKICGLDWKSFNNAVPLFVLSQYKPKKVTESFCGIKSAIVFIYASLVEASRVDKLFIMESIKELGTQQLDPEFWCHLVRFWFLTILMRDLFEKFRVYFMAKPLSIVSVSPPKTYKTIIEVNNIYGSSEILKKCCTYILESKKAILERWEYLFTPRTKTTLLLKELDPTQPKIESQNSMDIFIHLKNLYCKHLIYREQRRELDRFTRLRAETGKASQSISETLVILANSRGPWCVGKEAQEIVSTQTSPTFISNNDEENPNIRELEESTCIEVLSPSLFLPLVPWKEIFDEPEVYWCLTMRLTPTYIFRHLVRFPEGSDMREFAMVTPDNLVDESTRFKLIRMIQGGAVGAPLVLGATQGTSENDSDSHSKTHSRISSASLVPDPVETFSSSGYHFLISLPCELIQFLYVFPGQFQLTKDTLSFIGKKSRDDDEQTNYAGSEKYGKDKHFPINQIKEIHYVRYKLLHTALEFFMKNGETLLVNFSEGQRKRVINKLKTFSGITIQPSSNVDELHKILQYTHLWENRLISTFDYLMFLNYSASRTSASFSQYPIMPWVLRDYTSDELDLKNPASFRDFRFNMAAQTAQNRMALKDNFETAIVIRGPDVPCHLNQFCSSVYTPIRYLARLEPFTSFLVQHQDGHFDDPNRIFCNIPKEFEMNESNPSICEELIPEFFTLPDFLRNTNRIVFGTRSDKTVVGDVILPNWAQTPESFVAKHREALESDFVSSQIHNWIDLFFGCKQSGKHAINAFNLFRIDLYEISMTDPRLNAARAQSYSEHTQIPVRLFRHAHPARRAVQECIRPFDPTIISLSKVDPIIFPKLDGKCTQITALHALPNKCGQRNFGKKMIVLSKDFSILRVRWRKCAQKENRPLLRRAEPNELIQAENKFMKGLLFSTHSQFSEMEQKLGAQKKRVEPFVEKAFHVKAVGLSQTQTRFPYFQTEEQLTTLILPSQNGNYIFLGASRDASLRVLTVKTGETVQLIPGHRDLITTMTLSQCGKYLITGSLDTSVILWKVHNKALSKGRQRLPLAPFPKFVLSGHDAPVTCVNVDVPSDLIVSASQDGVLIFSSLSTGAYLRSIMTTVSRRSYPTFLAIAEGRALLVYYEKSAQLRTYGFTGTLLAKTSLKVKARIRIQTPCRKFLITVAPYGQISVFRIVDLKVMNSLTIALKQGQTITAACIIYYGQLLVLGLNTGGLFAYPLFPYISRTE